MLRFVKCVFTQPFGHPRDVTQDQFVRGVKLVWIQTFYSPWLLAKPRLKCSVYLIIYLKEGELIDLCFFQGHWHKVNANNCIQDSIYYDDNLMLNVTYLSSIMVCQWQDIFQDISLWDIAQRYKFMPLPNGGTCRFSARIWIWFVYAIFMKHYKVRIKVKWSNPGKGVALALTPWCSSYRKGSLRVTLD